MSKHGMQAIMTSYTKNKTDKFDVDIKWYLVIVLFLIIFFLNLWLCMSDTCKKYLLRYDIIREKYKHHKYASLILCKTNVCISFLNFCKQFFICLLLYT